MQQFVVTVMVRDSNYDMNPEKPAYDKRHVTIRNFVDDTFMM